MDSCRDDCVRSCDDTVTVSDEGSYESIFGGARTKTVRCSAVQENSEGADCATWLAVGVRQATQSFIYLYCAYCQLSVLTPAESQQNLWCEQRGSHTVLLPFPPSSSGLIIHEGSSVYRIFKRWQAVNQQWKVLNYEKSKDLGDPVSSNSKTGARGSRNNSHGLASSGGQQSRRLRTILNHHCGYTILHILSQLRPTDPRISAAANREVVMRVTTVWVHQGLCAWTDLSRFVDLRLETDAATAHSGRISPLVW